jgi:hypothetical protein
MTRNSRRTALHRVEILIHAGNKFSAVRRTDPRITQPDEELTNIGIGGILSPRGAVRRLLPSVFDLVPHDADRSNGPRTKGRGIDVAPSVGLPTRGSTNGLLSILRCGHMGRTGRRISLAMAENDDCRSADYLARRRLDCWRILARFRAHAAHLQPTCLMKVSK